jgi:hypothetical protein
MAPRGRLPRWSLGWNGGWQTSRRACRLTLDSEGATEMIERSTARGRRTRYEIEIALPSPGAFVMGARFLLAYTSRRSLPALIAALRKRRDLRFESDELSQAFDAGALDAIEAGLAEFTDADYLGDDHAT